MLQDWLPKNVKDAIEIMVAHLDDFIFIKKGYSFCKHLVPFSIAALLLLILSIPEDDLFLRLVDLLQKPNWIWLPAGLLTVVAIVVYVVNIRVQVHQAYLWTDGDCRRTITTFVTYMVLCTLMAYGVLKSASSQTTTLGDIWGCLLLAVLSLTGIGWSVPGSWVESMGIKSPNYTEGRFSADELEGVLEDVREKPYAEEKDIKRFLEASNNLYTSIKRNFALEPEWAKDKLSTASGALRTLIEQVEEKFATGTWLEVEDFAAACKCQKYSQYPEFITALRTLSDYWCGWQCQESKRGS